MVVRARGAGRGDAGARPLMAGRPRIVVRADIGRAGGAAPRFGRGAAVYRVGVYVYCVASWRFVSLVTVTPVVILSVTIGFFMPY